MHRLAILVAAVLCSALSLNAQSPPTVTISDTIVTPFGQPFRGRVSITLRYSGPLSAGSATLAAGFIRLDVTNGSLTVSLVPNSAINPPGTSYSVRYISNSGYSWDEVWVVPESPAVNTVSNVRVSTVPSPLTMIMPHQISTLGAQAGQVLTFNGSSVVWGTVSGGGGGSVGSVSWGGITGTLSNQTDLWNALSGKAAASHSHSLSDITQSGAAIGQVPMWNGSGWVPANPPTSGPSGSDSLWSSGSGGAIYYNSGNVGVGTSIPSDRLTVASTQSSGLSVIDSSNGYALASIRRGATSQGEISLFSNGNESSIIRASGNSILNGQLGIGKTPTSALDVNGTVKANSFEGSLDWSYLSNAPSTYPPSQHVHAASDIATGTIATARLGAGTAGASTFLRGDSSWAQVGWNDISGKPSAFPPSAHSHTAADITSGTISTERLGAGAASASTFLRGDQTWAQVPVTSVFGRTGAVTASAGDYTASQITNSPAGNIAATTVQEAINELDAEKAAVGHTHAAADITSGTIAAARLGTGTPGSSNFLRGDQTWASVGWADVAGKPTTFPPESHVHSAADITTGTIAAARLGSGTASSSTFLRGDQTWASVGWNDVAGKPSAFPPSSHSHSAADITSGLMAAERLGSGVPGASKFLRGDQQWAEIDWSQVTGKPSAFPPSAHTHALDELGSGGATAGQVLVWNGSQWAPSSITTQQPNYSQSFTSQTTVTLNHNAGTSNVIIACYDSSDSLIIPQSVVLSNANEAVVSFGAPTTGRCVVNSTGGSGGGGGLVYVGTGLIGTGSPTFPIQIDPNAGFASQVYVYGNVDFGVISAGSCSESTIPASGLSASMAVAPAWPASIPQGLLGMMYTGPNVLVVRLCNVTQGDIDPPALTYGGRVIGGM